MKLINSDMRCVGYHIRDRECLVLHVNVDVCTTPWIVVYNNIHSVLANQVGSQFIELVSVHSQISDVSPDHSAYVGIGTGQGNMSTSIS